MHQFPVEVTNPYPDLAALSALIDLRDRFAKHRFVPIDGTEHRLVVIPKHPEIVNAPEPRAGGRVPDRDGWRRACDRERIGHISALNRIGESITVAVDECGRRREGGKMDFIAIREAVAITIRIKRRGAMGGFRPVGDAVMVRVGVMGIGVGGDFRGVVHAVAIRVHRGVGKGGIQMTLDFEGVRHAVAIRITATVDDLQAMDCDRIIVDGPEAERLDRPGEIPVADKISGRDPGLGVRGDFLPPGKRRRGCRHEIPVCGGIATAAEKSAAARIDVADVNEKIVGGVGNSRHADRDGDVARSAALGDDHSVEQALVTGSFVQANLGMMIRPRGRCRGHLPAMVLQGARRSAQDRSIRHPLWQGRRRVPVRQAEKSGGLPRPERRGVLSFANKLQADRSRKIKRNRGGVCRVAALFEFDVIRESVAIGIRGQRAGGGFLAVGKPIAIGVGIERIGPERELAGIRQPVIVAVRVRGISACQKLREIAETVRVGVGQGVRRVRITQAVKLLEPKRHAVGVGIREGAGIRLQPDEVQTDVAAGPSASAFDLQDIRPRDGGDRRGGNGEHQRAIIRDPVAHAHGVAVEGHRDIMLGVSWKRAADPRPARIEIHGDAQSRSRRRLGRRQREMDAVPWIARGHRALDERDVLVRANHADGRGVSAREVVIIVFHARRTRSAVWPAAFLGKRRESAIVRA